MCRILADLNCTLDCCFDIEDVLCLPSHSFSHYETGIAVLLRYLPLCRASIKLSTCTCDLIPLERQRGLRLPSTFCVTTLGCVCRVPPPRLSVSCLHFGVVCHDVSPSRNLTSVNIAQNLKPEASVLSTYQAYSSAA